jgi:hypothetical protein
LGIPITLTRPISPRALLTSKRVSSRPTTDVCLVSTTSRITGVVIYGPSGVEVNAGVGVFDDTRHGSLQARAQPRGDIDHQQGTPQHFRFVVGGPEHRCSGFSKARLSRKIVAKRGERLGRTPSPCIVEGPKTERTD